jgi:hypothetical protein
MPSQASSVALVPSQYRSVLEDSGAGLDIASAKVYLALHPLFTSRPEIISLFSSTERPILCLDKPYVKLINTIARSAALIIETFAQSNKDLKIISLWVAAERILEAGVVWATYLTIVHTQILDGGLSGLGWSTAMAPLHKCTSLLTSIAQRWRGGTIYPEVWDTFLSLFWGILR